MATSTHVTSTSSGGKTSVHDVSFRGLVGTIFWLLLVSILIYIIAFVTPGWQSIDEDGDSEVRVGLWETCMCGVDLPGQDYTEKDFFIATQAMICIGLIFQLLALCAFFLYMWIHKINKNLTLMIFIILSFTAVLFMAIGFIVFGVETEKEEHGGGNLSYSYIMAVIAGCLCLFAAIAGLFQMIKAKRG